MLMSKSLLFIPDISGYTHFIQTTEVEHSQHVIAELLEILIESNDSGFELAEIEGDALFFYLPDKLLPPRLLLNQIEKMFTAFYSHLSLLKHNRICPCNACASAPNLQLKIVAHCGDLQFINVQGTRKPFGPSVIEVHRLLKNSVQSDNYSLISEELMEEISMDQSFASNIFNFNQGTDIYDGKNINYSFSKIDPKDLVLDELEPIKKIKFNREPDLTFHQSFPVDAAKLLESITNYKYRLHWTEGVDKLEYKEEEVTRLGTEHKCIVKGTELDFTTVTTDANQGQLVYGEYTDSPPPVDGLYQFYIITPVSEIESTLKLELYWETNSLFKKLLMKYIGKSSFKKNINKALEGLLEYLKT